ncbi:Synaptogenesis protein syg-2 [Caenorhabditis elegans]|nr:Synaptogenesis protein syg-2 [Caenorhabditis elegans]CAB63432.2 Synaptogenesis protein syg-2 [Caenorhabditis elegans]|eukprot:NP_001309467.1 Synaptogenesis protein syg-2 [Caenorhabditis elegans]
MLSQAILLWLFGSIHISSQFFLESPSNLSTIAGESITFRCSAEKSPEPIVYSQWKSNTGSLLGYHQEGILPGHQGRFSYIKQNAEELHLKITHVNLDDDGEYECQMLHPEEGPIRAKSFLNIIVPPQLVYFSNYQPNSIIAVKENTPLNITCVVPNVKPEPEVLWYMDGKVMSRDVKQASTPHLNKTFTVYTSLVVQSDRNDHGKVITCEAFQKETDIRITTNTTLDVLFPPSDPTVEILRNPSALRSGDNVTIACSVTGGNPPPDVFWYHENKRLQSHSTLDTRSKEIKNIYSFIASQNDNMAEYECRANNSRTGNPKRKAMKLEVNYPPASVELFGESNIRYGSSANIQCKSLPSNPASQITWIINGRSVPTPTQREFVVENGIVSSSNVSVHSNELSVEAHQINVECMATNPEGSSAKQHVIKIIAPPKAPIITGLEDRKFFEGDIVNVTCEAQGGNPLAELSWYRGSEKVNGAHNEVAGFSSYSTLALRVDRTMNTQRLKCEATNAALDEPLIESQYLSVYYPPRRVLIRPADSGDQRLLVGKSARLVCGTLSSNPAAHISWQFSRATDDNKVHLGDVSLNETTRDNGFNVENVLSFTPTEEYDGTVVHCIANHPEWKHSVNTSFPLNVMYPPKMLVNDPVTVVMSEGDSFKENLTVRGNPAISLWQWRKNGVPFDHTIGRVFARGAVLSGKQLLSTDAGVYTLTATNSVGSTNITIKLAVEYSARITSISTPVIAATGDTVLLECEADGEPSKANMIHWYKNGEILAAQHRGHKKAILRLNATEQQSGEYTCKADNGIGVPAEGQTFLLVNSAPRVLPVARYAKTAGILGGVAKARCKVYAVPTVEFVWEKDEQLIKKNSSKYSIVNTQIDYSTYESTLWIKNIVPDDYTKKVKCIARNSFGTDHLSIPIIPPTHPDEPFNLTMTNSTLNTISVAWEPRFDGGSDQIFEVKYRRQNDDLIHLVNTTHTNLRLSGLATANTYFFQIRSINARGFASSWTSPVIFATLNEDGVNVAMIRNEKLKLTTWIPYILIFIVLFMLLNVVICCFVCNRTKKRKLREKTEMARTAINGGDVRQVQMYGTMMGNDGMSRRDIDDRPEMSEDEHSVRTMIEVSPNGYMQPIEPMLYESTGLLEYDYQTRSYMGSSQGTRSMTYANVPYPEPPQPSYHSNWNSLQRQSNNNTSPQHHLSTFINPNMGVRAGPINYAQLDGDLV